MTSEVNLLLRPIDLYQEVPAPNCIMTILADNMSPHESSNANV